MSVVLSLKINQKAEIKPQKEKASYWNFVMVIMKRNT
jgi:hypothetical protein